MKIKVMIPVALRQFADGKDTVQLNGNNVGQVLQHLRDDFPELKRHLFADDGQLRSFVNVFVNDDNIRDRENQDTPLKEGDELAIIPAVAGGAAKGAVSS